MLKSIHTFLISKEDKKGSPDEIIADLEAMLNKTAEELDQQKRLTQALLRRKVVINVEGLKIDNNVSSSLFNRVFESYSR